MKLSDTVDTQWKGTVAWPESSEQGIFLLCSHPVQSIVQCSCSFRHILTVIFHRSIVKDFRRHGCFVTSPSLNTATWLLSLSLSLFMTFFYLVTMGYSELYPDAHSPERLLQQLGIAKVLGHSRCAFFLSALYIRGQEAEQHRITVPTLWYLGFCVCKENLERADQVGFLVTLHPSQSFVALK